MQVEDKTIYHLELAQELIGNHDLETAAIEAETAVDLCWKYGDAKITRALPLLSYINYSSGSVQCLFKELDDLPDSMASSLMEEAAKLDYRFHNLASTNVVNDVRRFLARYESFAIKNPPPTVMDVNDEKIVLLKEQVIEHKAAGKKRLALETMIELANEYSFRFQNHRALDLYRLILKQAWRYKFTDVRTVGLFEFGRFYAKLHRLEDAERVFRLGAGVAKKARDRDRYAKMVAELGIVLAHAKKRAAPKYLHKAKEMLDDDSDRSKDVLHHIDAICSGTECKCHTAKNSSRQGLVSSKV